MLTFAVWKKIQCITKQKSETIKDNTSEAHIFLLNRLLDVRDTNTPISISKTALKPKAPNIHESIKMPHARPVKKEASGELNIEKAVSIGSTNKAEIPPILKFSESVK